MKTVYFQKHPVWKYFLKKKFSSVLIDSLLKSRQLHQKTLTWKTSFASHFLLAGLLCTPAIIYNNIHFPWNRTFSSSIYITPEPYRTYPIGRRNFFRGNEISYRVQVYDRAMVSQERTSCRRKVHKASPETGSLILLWCPAVPEDVNVFETKNPSRRKCRV